MKRLKLILFTLFIFIFNLSLVNAKDDVINRIDVSITLDNLGNAHIEEVWDTKANMGSEFYKALYNLGNMEISNFKVYENGVLYTFVDDWDINASLDAKRNKNGYNYTSDGVEICWGKGSMGSHIYRISYDLSNFVFKTSDAEVVYWQVINEGMSSVPKQFSLVVNGFYYFPDSLDVWGFGYKGYAYVKDGQIQMSNEENTNLSSNNYAVLLAKFPVGTFTLNDNNTYERFENFDEVLNMAKEGSFSYKYNNTFLETILPILVSILCPLFVIIMVAIFASKNGYGFESLGKKIDQKTLHNFRDIPCKKDIFRAYFIAKAYSLNKKETDFLGSLLLKWLFEGKIEIKKQEVDKLIGSKQEQIIVLKPGLTFTNSVEKEMYDILISASKDYNLENKELEKWSNKNYNRLFNWFDSCETYGRGLYESEGQVYKNKGKFIIKDSLKEEAIKLAGLKKYLTEFSRIKEKQAIEVMLWKEYLMFAQIFGIADKVAEQFKNLYPKEIYEYSENYNFDIADVIILNSISHNAVSRASSARSAAQSYSGGGGGFSIGGGGGGSFGGGGGGGR